MKKLFILLLLPILSLGQVKFIPRPDFQYVNAMARMGDHYYLSAYFSDNGISFYHSRIYKLNDQLDIVDSLSFPTIVRGFGERNDTLYFTVINGSTWTDSFYLVDSNLTIIDSLSLPNTSSHFYTDLEFRDRKAYLLGAVWVGGTPMSFLKIIDLDNFSMDHIDLSAQTGAGEFTSMGFVSDTVIDLYPFFLYDMHEYSYDLLNQTVLDSVKNTFYTIHTVQADDSTYYGGGDGYIPGGPDGILFNKNGDLYQFYKYVDTLESSYDFLSHKAFDANSNFAFLGAYSQWHDFDNGNAWGGGTIAKTDLQGNIIWFKSIFDNKPFLSSIYFSAIKATDDGGCLAASYYYKDSVTQDIILFKIDSAGNINYIGEREYPIKSITVYPNPASDEVMLEGFPEDLQYAITSMNGARVKEGSIRGGQLDISYLEKGMYQLQVLDEDGRKYSTRFVKN